MDDIVDAVEWGCSGCGTYPVALAVLILLIIVVLRQMGVIPDSWWETVFYIIPTR